MGLPCTIQVIVCVHAWEYKVTAGTRGKEKLDVCLSESDITRCDGRTDGSTDGRK